MSRKLKKGLARIIIAILMFALVILLPLEGYFKLAAYLAVYGFIGWDILWKAVRNILNGQIFDENFLMSVATVGAFVLGEYMEGIAVMLFYQVGEWFQKYAVGKSRRSIASLMDIRPDYANLKMPDGSIQEVDPEKVAVDDLIIVKPGERVPLDGIVQEGSSALDTSALTGESLPRDIQAGAEVISGCINLTGAITVKVSKLFGESTVSRILEMVENSSSRKAETENFITRFARVYTPAVCFAALALALLPPLITGQEFSIWVYRALTFLVISCPCALVISIPLSFFGGIGGASRSGVLVKGSNYLEALAQVDTVVFDKTGTLTKGEFTVSEINAVGTENNTLLEKAAKAECYSSHPIALSIRKAYGKDIDPAAVKDVEELAGFGVKALVDGVEVLAGNYELMIKQGVDMPEKSAPDGTTVHVSANSIYLGWLLVEDEIKADAPEAIRRLKKLGIHKTVMLTGDVDAAGRKVAAKLGIDKVYTQLFPVDKVAKVEEMLDFAKTSGSNKKLAFVGDGVNDAPVLARADVGVAMGGLGSDAAIEAADVVIMTDQPSKLAQVISIARKTNGIVRQNIVFALGVKAIVLIFGALGMASMWAAVFADVGVSVIAILNAMRALSPVKFDE